MASARSAASRGAARSSGPAIRRISPAASLAVVKGIAELPNDTVIDGEVVALDQKAVVAHGSAESAATL
jgi:hypothetical protein